MRRVQGIPDSVLVRREPPDRRTCTEPEPLPVSSDSLVPVATEPPLRRERIPLAIAYMVGATVLFAGTSALSKWLVETYPIGEVLFTRAAVSLIACGLLILPFTGFSVFRTRRPTHHVLRGVSQALSQGFILVAFSLMPLAAASAINFSAPLWATLIAALVLKEPVGVVRWAALVIGFCGVLLVAAPGAETFQVGALFALANAILYGSVTAGVRGMTATESTETLTMYQMTLLTAAFALLLPFGFVMPSPRDALIMVLNGLGNALGQYWWTRSLHLAPASAVTPYYYLSLIWAMLFGYIGWGDMPTVSLLLGSAIVVGSGLFLLWREAQK